MSAEIMFDNTFYCIKKSRKWYISEIFKAKK